MTGSGGEVEKTVPEVLNRGECVHHTTPRQGTPGTVWKRFWLSELMGAADWAGRSRGAAKQSGESQAAACSRELPSWRVSRARAEKGVLCDLQGTLKHVSLAAVPQVKTTLVLNGSPESHSRDPTLDLLPPDGTRFFCFAWVTEVRVILCCSYLGFVLDLTELFIQEILLNDTGSFWGRESVILLLLARVAVLVKWKQYFIQ